jgi:8-hydroxy-5-deazaflavin:NADPH oxidoreductase
MSPKKVGIVGDGNVGGALARGLLKAARQVRTVGNDKPGIRETADWADIVILAVPYQAIGSVIEAAGSALDGKVLVDVTNVLDSDMNLALGFTTSGAEELQNRVRNCHVVKAFNTIFAQHMDTGRLADQPLTVFAAGDDVAARSDVLELAREIGFDPVDAGPLRNARLLEPLGYLNIQLGYVQKMGTNIGIKLLRS